jgi:pyruvate/2-oxoglutarate dehydrogenase complex dihydrolipoamide acyltransferase (E2) component
MGTPIKMPDLGTEATSERALRRPRTVGVAVAAGDAAAEVETEEALVRPHAPVVGAIVETARPGGAAVPVGGVLKAVEHE